MDDVPFQDAGALRYLISNPTSVWRSDAGCCVGDARTRGTASRPSRPALMSWSRVRAPGMTRARFGECAVGLVSRRPDRPGFVALCSQDPSGPFHHMEFGESGFKPSASRMAPPTDVRRKLRLRGNVPAPIKNRMSTWPIAEPTGGLPCCGDRKLPEPPC